MVVNDVHSFTDSFVFLSSQFPVQVELILLCLRHFILGWNLISVCFFYLFFYLFEYPPFSSLREPPTLFTTLPILTFAYHSHTQLTKKERGTQNYTQSEHCASVTTFLLLPELWVRVNEMQPRTRQVRMHIAVRQGKWTRKNSRHMMNELRCFFLLPHHANMQKHEFLHQFCG